MGVSLNSKYAIVLQGVLLLYFYYYYSCYATTISLPAPMSKSPSPPFPHYCFSLKIPLLAHHSSLTRLRSFCWAFFTAMSRLLSYQVACLVYCTKDFFWALSSSLSLVGGSNAGPILSWQQSQQITQIFHPLLLMQHQFVIQFNSIIILLFIFNYYSSFNSIIIILKILYCIV